MKNAIMGCCFFLIGMYLVLLCNMQFTLQLKDKELSAVSTYSMKNAITYIYNTDHASQDDVENVIQETIRQRMMKDSIIRVELYTVDCENGVVTAFFTSTWKQSNGKQKELKVKRSMMIDQKKGV